MVNFFNHIFFLLLIHLFCSKNIDSFSDKLKLTKVIVVFRHGLRAPLRPYVFDPNGRYESQFWPEGFGSLLTKGKLQMFKLGEQLRTRYLDLLVPYGKSVAEDIQIVSTVVDRCYMSAALMLAGFYPPVDEKKWNDELVWQPVPILLESPDKTDIFSHKQNCPVVSKIFQDYFSGIKSEKETTYLYNYLFNQTSSNSTDAISSLVYLNDYFIVKRQLGLTLPQWANDDFLNRLDKFYIKVFQFFKCTEKIHKLFIGPLIQDMLHRIHDNINNKSTNSKFYFYSGHDITIYSLLSAMGFEITFVPVHGASVIFELYRSSSNNYFIRILHSKNYTLQHIEIKVLPKCDEFCPWEKFVQIFNEYMELDWEKECKEFT